MYSANLGKKLTALGIVSGDRVRITSAHGEFEGVLMPKPAGGDPKPSF